MKIRKACSATERSAVARMRDFDCGRLRVPEIQAFHAVFRGP